MKLPLKCCPSGQPWRSPKSWTFPPGLPERSGCAGPLCPLLCDPEAFLTPLALWGEVWVAGGEGGEERVRSGREVGWAES